MFSRFAGAFLAGLALAVAPAAALAQDAQQEPKPVDPMSLEELQKRFLEHQEKSSREIEDLRLQVESLEQEVEEARAASRSTPTQAGNVFNPAITVFGNILGRLDDEHVFAEDDPTGERIDSRLNLREVEFDFRAAIDPWADAVVILSVESPSPNEFETSIEEGYFTLKKLPFLDSAPAGLKLHVGRMREEFGRFNKVHLHDLPQPSYPRALTNFLGTEGYAQNGAAGQFFLPSPGESSTLQATAALLDGGDIPIDDQGSGADVAVLGHLAWFGELGESDTLEVGASSWNGDGDHALYGMDVTFEHKPFAGGEWHSFLIGGECFVAVLDDPSLDDRPLGWFVWSQYQLSRNAYVGVRFDRAEEPSDSSLATETVGAYLTYYTSEFLRFRLGYEHAESDVAFLDERDTALIELNFVFGSHPTEPYWVNR